MTLDADFYARPAPLVARDLLGCVMSTGDTAGRIVEVEIYDQHDPASHSFRGITPRTAVMFGPPGRLYVYRSYGIHWCVNVVCQPEGEGAAVLIRALQPLEGLDVMRARRGLDAERLLCAGPGRLCQALAIDGTMNGTSVVDGPVRIFPGRAVDDVVVGPRIGISVAVDEPRRLGEAGSQYCSRPFPRRIT